MKHHQADREISEELQHLLEESRMSAPDGFTQQVMNALPQHTIPVKRKPERWWWPSNGTWLVPALAGAAVMMFVWLGIHLLTNQSPSKWASNEQRIWVSFELHAPDARQVELAGNFNDWDAGTIELTGPDATGHWSVDVQLPAGRYEYLFLVDGEKWITDPGAMAYRDDGFGLRNAVLEL